MQSAVRDASPYSLTRGVVWLKRETRAVTNGIRTLSPGFAFISPKSKKNRLVSSVYLCQNLQVFMSQD